MVLNGTHEFSDILLADGTPVVEISESEKAVFFKTYQDGLLNVLKKTGSIPVRVNGNIRWCKVRKV
jgi:hypothetical protein